ncbi:MAG: FecCD family ABC transporter permease [Conexivisphaera sp.]
MRGGLLHLLLPLFFALSVLLGPYGIVNPLAHGLGSFVMELRILRALSAALVGVALSASGSGLQVLLKNPLADPYILGVSSGAALGVLAAVAAGLIWPLEISIAALAGGLAALFVVMVVSSALGLTSVSMILVGVAASYALSSIDMVLMMDLGPAVQGSLAWLFGTVAYVLWSELAYAAPLMIAGALWIFLRAGHLESLMLGDDVAESMGVRTRRLRAEIAVASALSTSAAVAVAGPVGFVGLVAPWLARLGSGGAFRRTYPLSLSLGASLTVAADLASRFVQPGGMAPLTSITALMGAPVLVYLLARLRR